jgi:hypothetical protein
MTTERRTAASLSAAAALCLAAAGCGLVVDLDGREEPLVFSHCYKSEHCLDDNPCNGIETCSAVTHLCEPGANIPAGSTCNDGLVCTSTSACDGEGHCVGQGNPCDDGLVCTQEVCAESPDGPLCEAPQLLPGWCRISEPTAVACYEDGAVNPNDTCERCDSDARADDWSGAPAGTPCNDALACTHSTTCDADGDCVGILEATACLIDGACRSNGQHDPANSCRVCSPLDSPYAWTPLGDMQQCNAGTGICCSGECRVGKSCCADIDCATGSHCIEYVCTP